MSDSTSSSDQTAPQTAVAAASHTPPMEIADVAPAAAPEQHSGASEPCESAEDPPVTAPSVAASSEPAVQLSSDDASAPSVASVAPASPAPTSVADESAAVQPSISPAKPSARRSANPAMLSGSTAANRSALLSSGRSSTFVPRNRASDVAKPKPVAATAAASSVGVKPAAAAATPRKPPTPAASASSSAAPRPSTRPSSATPRKLIVLAQPPPSHSAARGNRRIPQPPEPPGYSGLLYSHVLGAIFAFLEFASLRSAVCVSPSWRGAVGAMRPIASAKFKFVFPLKKLMQLTESSPLNKHVSQIGGNDAIHHAQEINLTLLAPMARWFTHLTTMHIKIGASAWLTKATKTTFPFPPSLTALGWSFLDLPRILPPESMINQVTHQLLASIAAMPRLERLYLMLHWTATLDLSALQAPHDRGSLRHFSFDFHSNDMLTPKQIASLRSLAQLESLVLVTEPYEDASPQRALLAVPHPPFAWQRIMRLRDLDLQACVELIPPLTQLRELDLFSISEGLVALHALPHLSRLSLLMNYSHQFKAAESAEVTVGVAGCVHLTALKIHEAHISSAQLTTILAPLMQLRELTLSYLGHLESYDWATSGPITQTLRSLSIASSSKRVPVGGFQALRELRGLRRLEFLHERWNGVSQEERRAATPPSIYWPAMQRFRYKEDHSWW